MYNCRCVSHNGFLTERGYAELAQRTSLEGLAPRGDSEYLDKVVSVSGSIRDEAPLVIWPERRYIRDQYRRFLNGY